MTFSEFVQQLLSSPSNSKVISIKNKNHTLRGVTKLTSINYLIDVGYYYKVFFTDHSVLIIIPKLEQLQFSETGDLGAISGISDNDIGNKEVVEYNGKKYKLENPHDYQYALELIFGNFEDVEGECKFSDYVGIDDPNNSLSLALLSFNGQRADVQAHNINVSDISFIS